MLKTAFLLFVSFALYNFTPAAFAQDISPLTVEGAETVDALRAKELYDRGYAFIDLRTSLDYQLSHIPNSHNLDIAYSFNRDSFKNIVNNAEGVVFYCFGPACLRSYAASTRALSWGYQNVKYFRDGFPAWQAAGYPVNNELQ